MTSAEVLEDRLMRRLEELGIAATTHRHPAVHTVAQSKELRGALPGRHIRNLFLRDKKHNMWLVTVAEDLEVDLKRLRRALDARGNLSFGAPALLAEHLGVEPGAVTPFAIMNDAENRVAFVLDRSLLADEPINAHPLHNEATTAIAPRDILRFAAACGHEPAIMDFPDLSGP
jgi:Ala-tRNA(Pro) deacylase